MEAKALWDFQAEQKDDLSFQQGDIILVTSAPEGEEWWQGEIDGAIGNFPASYVELEQKGVVSSSKDSEIEPIATTIALYDFKPAHEDELEFTEGVSVVVLRIEEDEWLYGYIEGDSTRLGRFPKTYVESWDKSEPEEPPPPLAPRKDKLQRRRVSLRVKEKVDAGFEGTELTMWSCGGVVSCFGPISSPFHVHLERKGALMEIKSHSTRCVVDNHIVHCQVEEEGWTPLFSYKVVENPILPLKVSAQWKHDQHKADVLIHYAVHPSLGGAVEDIQFVFTFEHSIGRTLFRPTGVVLKEDRKLCWNVGNWNAEQGIGKALGRFEVELLQPPSVNVEFVWKTMSKLPSGVMFFVKGAKHHEFELVVENGRYVVV